MDESVDGNNLPPSFNPSPDEIAQRCAAIQSSWSDGERQSRRVGPAALYKHKTAGVADAALGSLSAKLAKHREMVSQSKA